jgi:hypothetical protein
MSGRGVFAVDRGIWEHPVFARERFTEREAFLWLISEAAWKARRVKAGSSIIDLERGQLSHSLRFLARKWGWLEPRVRRFFARLKNDSMIDARADAGQTLITICNYDTYQRVSLPSDAPRDARATRERRKEEDIKALKEEKAPPAGLSAGRSRKVVCTPEFDAFWSSYPATKSANPKGEAFKAFERLSPEDRGLATASLPAYRAWVAEQFPGYQPCGSAVYLRQRRFERHADEGPPKPCGTDPETIRAGLQLKAEYFFRGEWRPGWGAAPGEPGCIIPDDVIRAAEAEHQPLRGAA